MATATQAPLNRRATSGVTWPRRAQRLRGWLWHLPIRVEDPRLWLAAGLGLLLRWGALLGDWWLLREALTLAIVAPLRALGMPIEILGRGVFASGQVLVSMSVSCTHIEVFALLAPLLCSRRRSPLQNGAVLLAGFAGMLLAAVLRVDIAVLLAQQGWSWHWAHDVLLGGCYAAFIVLTCHVGGWMRAAPEPATSGASAEATEARLPRAAG